MDDMNKNNSDDFEFKEYSKTNNNKQAKDPQYEGFEAYHDENSQNNVVPEFIETSQDSTQNNFSQETSRLNSFTKSLIDEDNEEDNIEDEIQKKKRIRNKNRRLEEEEKRKKSLISTISIFVILLIIIMGSYTTIINTLPDNLMKQGKKYLEIQNYDKALAMFKRVTDKDPFNDEAAYYQVLALSKMPVNNETQKALYEISQMEGCDKGSNYADAILINMKKQIDKQVGSNYAGNALYNDILFRWNNNEPITYFVNNLNGSSIEYINTIKKAFSIWSSASNGQIIFKETTNSNADIVISFVDKVGQKEDDGKIGDVIPVIQNRKLNKVNINLNTRSMQGTYYPVDKFKTVAAHEIGHALGIWGHSYNPNDIMYETGDYITKVPTNKGLSKRDVNTLNLVYNMVPDVINKPLSPLTIKNLFYHYVITSIPGEDFEIETQRKLSQLKHSNDIVEWVDLGIKYGEAGQYVRSNTIFTSVLSMTVNDKANQFVVLYNLANNYYKMKDYKVSRKFLTLATRYRSDMDTQILDAFLDVKMDRKNIAQIKLMELNDKYPDNIEVALKLSEVYRSDKNKDKAKEVIEKLIKNNPAAARDLHVEKYQKYALKK